MFPALGTDTPLLRLPLVLGRNLWYNVHSTARLQALRSHGCVLEFGKVRAKLPQFHGIMSAGGSRDTLCSYRRSAALREPENLRFSNSTDSRGRHLWRRLPVPLNNLPSPTSVLPRSCFGKRRPHFPFALIGRELAVRSRPQGLRPRTPATF